MNIRSKLKCLGAIAAMGLFPIAMMMSGAALSAGKGAMTEKGMLTLYSGQKFVGESLEILKDRPNISIDFPIGSIAVFEGEKWEVCEGARYKAPCMTVSANQTNLGELTIRSARKIVDAPAG
jgi:hypothetical protein